MWRVKRILACALSLFGVAHAQDVDPRTPLMLDLPKGVAIAVTPITRQQWQAVMGSEHTLTVRQANEAQNGVSWEAAQDYTRQLSALTGDEYRLPTWEEWLLATRSVPELGMQPGVSEWTSSCAADGDCRVRRVRGGVWCSAEQESPYAATPCAWPVTHRSTGLGFRVVRMVKAKQKP